MSRIPVDFPSIPPLTQSSHNRLLNGRNMPKLPLEVIQIIFAVSLPLRPNRYDPSRLAFLLPLASSTPPQSTRSATSVRSYIHREHGGLQIIRRRARIQDFGQVTAKQVGPSIAAALAIFPVCVFSAQWTLLPFVDYESTIPTTDLHRSSHN